MGRLSSLFPVSWSPGGVSPELPLHRARSAVPTWNAASGASFVLDVRARSGAAWTAWAPLAEWSPGARRSLNGSARGIAIDTDVVQLAAPGDALELRVRDGDPAAVGALFAACPRSDGFAPSRQPDEHSVDLIVPERTQYVVEGERGWCSPASLAMLMAYHGRRYGREDWTLDVQDVAAEVFDTRYGGTGNWAFNMAFAATRGLVAFAAYLCDFEHARRFLRQAIPLALSYSWRAGELDGAPVEHSDGHLAVLRGMTSNGDPILNDPAHPEMPHVYPRAQLERRWIEGSGGLTYVVVPPELAQTAIALAGA